MNRRRQDKRRRRWTVLLKISMVYGIYNPDTWNPVTETVDTGKRFEVWRCRTVRLHG